MPTYVYRVVGKGEDETFEVQQSIHDSALTVHPETGEPIERVICTPQIGKAALSNSQLGAAGFTKYKKMSDGTYERQAGSGGPKHVNPRGLKGL